MRSVNTPPIWPLSDEPERTNPARRALRHRMSERRIDVLAAWINDHDHGSRNQPATTDPDAHFIPEDEYA